MLRSNESSGDRDMRQVEVAVVGIGSLTPGETSSRSFWRSVLEGDDHITDVPSTHWKVTDYYDADPAAKDHTYGRRGAFLPYVDFDPTRYGISPNALSATDSTQLLSLVVAERVLDDVRRNCAGELDRERVGVVIGTGALNLQRTMSNRMQRPVWLNALRSSGIAETDAQVICDRIADQYVDWQESTFPGMLGNVVAGRIANCFDLHGINLAVDAACASSLAAVSTAVGELASGAADTVIAGGADTLNDILTYMCFSKTPALSPTEDCRPFSDSADGTMLGEAIVMFALKRLSDAERAGDRIYAVVRGVGSASDGRGGAIYAPVPEGQSRALQRAYVAAGYGPDSVDLVESHGTGTPAGDAAEFTALRSVFASSGRSDTQWCALGSAKSQFGHTKSAAGAVGMLKVVLALSNKVLPPTIKVDRPNPALELADGPLYLNTEARPWIKAPGRSRRGSVSSFGFGGSNFHITLEEYTSRSDSQARPAALTRANPSELVLLSAPSVEELIAAADELAQTNKDLTVTAHESQLTFDASAPQRLSIVAIDREHLSRQLGRVGSLLRGATADDLTTPDAIAYSRRPRDEKARTAWVFPGQGAQYVGMGAGLAMSDPRARGAWDDGALVELGDRALHTVVHPIPSFSDEGRAEAEEFLTRTEWAQPGLAVHSLALMRVLDGLGMAPDCVAGHSFGELVALRAAGSLDDAGLLRLARTRGEVMRDAASEPGAMVSAAISRQGAQHVIEECGLSTVVVANHNGPRQVTLAGDVESIEIVEKRLVDDGISVRRLRISGAFHTPHMEAAVGPLAECLAALPVSPPEIDVYSNDGGAVYDREPDAVRARLSRHLVSPVNFVDEIEAMYEAGVRTFVEVGAGQSVTGMIGRILEGREHLAVGLDRPGRHALTTLQEGVGRLAVAGIAMDFASWWDDAPEDSSTAAAPRMSVKINGANYGTPAPPEYDATQPAPRVTTPSFEQPPQAHAPDQHVVSPMREAIVAEHESTQLDVEPVGAEWMAAFRESQRQSAETHSLFAQVMADSHRAYLATVEAAFSGLRVVGDPDSLLPQLPTHQLPTHQLPTHPAPRPQLPTPGGPLPRVSTPVPPLHAAAARAEPVVPQPDATDVTATLIEVIASKTGFPAEVIDAEMELAADLGIDSIKRVEILADLRQRLPGLASADMDVSQLAELTTVNRIADRFRSMIGPPGSVEEVAFAGGSSEPVVPQPDTTDVTATLIEVIASKTGFPAEVIDAEMELAADLGIDSIKRVEILADLRQRLPGLASADMDVSQLAELTTVDRIADRFRSMIGQRESVDVASPSDVTLSMNDSASGAPPTVAQQVSLDALVRSDTVMVDAPRPGLEVPGLRGGTIAVTDDGAGVAERVVTALRGRGLDAVAADDAVDVSGRTVTALVVLDALGEVRAIDDAIAVNRRVFESMRSAVTAFSGDLRSIVTVQSTGGDFGLSGRGGIRAWSGGAAALARTVDLESTDAVAKAVDIEVGSRNLDDIAAVIVGELLGGGSQRDVGISALGRRSVLKNVVSDLSDRPTVSAGLDQSDQVIVATGGARGVTARAVLALASHLVRGSSGSVRVVLLGRTELGDERPELDSARDEHQLRRALSSLAQQEGSGLGPAAIAAEASRIAAVREIRSTLTSMEWSGVHAEYVSVDVRDEKAVSDVLRDVRARLGAVTGIVHGAGVVEDRYLVDKSDEQFASVFETKVRGVKNLLDATAGDPVQSLFVFSSVSARFGNPGQSDYAMANEVMDQIAATVAVDRPDCIVRAIDWGPWDGGMVTTGLREHFRRSGAELVPLDAGADALVREWDLGPGAVRVSVTAVGGDGSLAARATSETVGTIHVDASTHPHLADHAPARTPVVPLTVALDWILGAARVWRPDARLLTVQNLQVVRGIELDSFESGGHDFDIESTQSADGIRVVLSSRRFGTHYNSTVALGGTIGRWAADGANSAVEPDPYGSAALFHGPRFRALKTVTCVDADGGCAQISGVTAMRWPTVAAHCDPMAMDAGLQMALLWAEQAEGAAFLPMSVSAATVSMTGPVGDGARVEVRSRGGDGLTALCDVAVLDGDGSVVAELLGVSLVRRTDVDAGPARISAGAGHHAH